MTDPRIEAAIAEIKQYVTENRDATRLTTDKVFAYCATGANDAANILRRHLAKPNPLIAELKALASLFRRADDVNAAMRVEDIITKYKERP